MSVAKVTLNNTSLIDITDTTAVASDVASGKYFYTADGTKTAGTSTGGGSGAGYVWQDAQGYVHLSDENASGGGGGGLEYESDTFTLTDYANEITINFTNTHSTPPSLFLLAENSGATPPSQQGTKEYIYAYVNWAGFFGNPVYADSSTSYSGLIEEWRKVVSDTTFGHGYGSVATTQPGISETGVSINLQSARSSFLQNVPYKWIAVWPPTT